MEQFLDLLTPLGRELAEWYKANSVNCPIRASDIVSSIIASQPNEQAYSTAYEMLYGPHQNTMVCGIILALHLLEGSYYRVGFKAARMDLVKRLVHIAMSAGSLRVAEEVYRALGLLVDCMTEAELGYVEHEISQFCNVVTGGGQGGSDPRVLLQAQLGAGTAEGNTESLKVFSSFVGFVFKLHSKTSSTSVEALVDAVKDVNTSVPSVSELIGVQSLSTVALNAAAASASTICLEESAAGESSVCDLALQTAALSRAMRLNALNNPTTAVAVAEGLRSLPGICSTSDTSTAVACLPHLGVCSELFDPRHITTNVLA